MKFSYGDKFYSYYSSIPNDHEIKPVPEKTGRAQTILGVQKFERRPEDGKIKYTIVS